MDQSENAPRCGVRLLISGLFSHSGPTQGHRGGRKDAGLFATNVEEKFDL